MTSLIKAYTNCRVRNNLARVVYRIEYKYSLLTQKLLKTEQLPDPASLLHRHVPVRQTHSAQKKLLVVPAVQTKLAIQAFSHAASAILNTLPHEKLMERASINMKRAPINSFKSELKTR